MYWAAGRGYSLPCPPLKGISAARGNAVHKLQYLVGYAAVTTADPLSHRSRMVTLVRCRSVLKPQLLFVRILQAVGGPLTPALRYAILLSAAIMKPSFVLMPTAVDRRRGGNTDDQNSGKRAGLIALGANPLESIRNIRSVEFVTNGVMYDCPQLWPSVGVKP